MLESTQFSATLTAPPLTENGDFPRRLLRPLILLSLLVDDSSGMT